MSATPPHVSLSPEIGGEDKGEGASIRPVYFETTHNMVPVARNLNRVNHVSWVPGDITGQGVRSMSTGV
jgi:hypothetical protein